MRLLLLTFIFFGLSLGINALAISPSSISVNVAPQNPAPYENVTITLSSFAANLDIVNISWFVNGKNTISGIGKKNFSLTLGAAGSESRVQAKIMLPDGEIDKTIILRPSVLTLLWQANDSHTPPFYKGKALPSLESEIKVVAMPELRVGGVAANPKTLNYEWKKDYSASPADSGYGKNSLVYSSDYLDTTGNIGVTASTLDQKFSSGADVTIGTYDPQISFYIRNEELGTLWERALGNPHRIEGDEVIVAIPYFVSPFDIRRPEFVFKWYINDLLVSVPSFQKNIMPLRVEAGTSGVSKLRLVVENTGSIFEGTSREVNIEF